MSMSMMNNSPGVCRMLEVQYAKHLGCVIFPNAAKSLPAQTAAAAAAAQTNHV